MKFFKLVFAFFLCALTLSAQQIQQSYLDYIKLYAPKAQEQEKEFGIPASITLAQGLLESGAGTSPLAREARNHFGIKCHTDWTGDKYYQDDDTIGECFRVYDDPTQSYDDHAKFLQRKRYQPLFQYPASDYKSWAQGLRQCGYATDPNYPQKLINLIELYHLDSLENLPTAQANRRKVVTKPVIEKMADDEENIQSKIGTVDATSASHKPLRNNGVLYVKAGLDDTYAQIAGEFNIRLPKLLEYNDYVKEPKLQKGEYVYLGIKRKQAARGNNTYKVKEGDTGHQIAQKYAIRLSSLYDLNELDYSKAVPCGKTLKLR